MDKRRLIYILSVVLGVLLVLAVVLSQCSKEAPAEKKPTATPQESTTDPTVATPEEPEPPTEYEPLEPTVPTEPEPTTPEPTDPTPTTPGPTTPTTPGSPEGPSGQIPNAIVKKADLQTLLQNFYCEYNEDGENMAIGILREEGKEIVYVRDENGAETVYETLNGVTTGYVRQDEAKAFVVDPVLNDGHAEEVLELLSAQMIYSSNKAKTATYRENPQAPVKTDATGVRIYEICEGENVTGYVGIDPALNICVFEESVKLGPVYSITDISTAGWKCPDYKPATP